MINSTPVFLPSACRHSWKCSTCYSAQCSSGCVAEVVLVVQSSQTLWVSWHLPSTRGTVCAHIQCGLGCTSHLYQSLFARNCAGEAGGRLYSPDVWGAVAQMCGGRAVCMGRSCLGELCVWKLCFILVLRLSSSKTLFTAPTLCWLETIYLHLKTHTPICA